MNEDKLPGDLVVNAPASQGEVKEWIFTFGMGQLHENCFTRIHGTFNGAREEMVRRFGTKWAFQYGSEAEAGVERFYLREIR